MKKILIFISLIFAIGCSKDPTMNSTFDSTAAKKTTDVEVNSTGSKSQADSSSNLIQAEHLKQVNSTSCQLSLSGSVTRYDPFYYTVIGSFPTSSSYPSVVVPKGTWQAGPYAFNNQGDGNLVVYVASTGRVLWASNTPNKNTRLDLQNDLNMVLYQVNGPPVFEAATYIYKCGDRNPLNTMLVLTIDGDLQIISDSAPTGTVVLASSRTFGGAQSPNFGSLFKLYRSSPGPGTYPFRYYLQQ
jgi:hypothetical protein